MLNKVQLIGRLGCAPDMRRTPAGPPVCALSVVTESPDAEGGTQTEWHQVRIGGKTAEQCAPLLHAGSLVYAEGKLGSEKWTGPDGKERRVAVVQARKLQLLDKKKKAAPKARRADRESLFLPLFGDASSSPALPY